MPIDIYKIGKASMAKLPKLKKALMVIGQTGQGKSTSILKLLGYEFVWRQKPNGGSKYLALAQPKALKPEHKSLQTSDSSSSVTQNLTAYDFSFKNVHVALIDSPGFNDTNGEERDISNQIYLEKAYASCEAICYLYMINLVTLKVGRGLGVIEFSKSIAARFAYKTLEEL